MVLRNTVYILKTAGEEVRTVHYLHIDFSEA